MAVGHAALFADGLEEAGTHAATEYGVEDQRGVAVLVGNGRRGDAETELHLFEGLLVLQQDARAWPGGRHLVSGFAGRQSERICR